MVQVGSHPVQKGQKRIGMGIGRVEPLRDEGARGRGATNLGLEEIEVASCLIRVLTLIHDVVRESTQGVEHRRALGTVLRQEGRRPGE